MRTSLVPNFLKTVSRNLNNFPAFRVYEVGRQYRKHSGQYFPHEEKYIVGAIVASEKSYTNKEVFFEAKGAVEGFLTDFKAQPWFFHENITPPGYAHPLKCVDIVIGDTPVGHIFELHPKVASNFNIEVPVGMFEINFSALAALPQRKMKYQPIPKYPAIDLDISILADRRMRSLDIENTIRKSDSAFIAGITLVVRGLAK